MAPWLLLVFLAAPPEVVLWHFPGPRGDALRQALVAAGAAEMPGQRLDEAAIAEHLRAAKWPASLGCLEDGAPCDDAAQAGLALVGAAARLDASADRDGEGFRVTLTRVPAGAGAPVTFEGRGATLEAAATTALTAMRGTSILEVAVTPPEAQLFLDGQPLGQGPGRYPVAPGEHTIRAEAPAHVTAEETVRVLADRAAEVALTLQAANGKLVLDVAPKHAKATLDGVPVAHGTGAFDVLAGKHALHVEAEGYDTHDETIEVPPGGRLQVKVELGAPRSGLLSDLPPPHPDTLAHGYYARGGLRLGGIASGSVDAGRGSGTTRSDVDEFADAQPLVGVDVALGWRGRIMMVEALGITLGASPGEVDATLERVTVDGTAEDLSRVVIRPAWVGARYPIERFEPYVLGGLELVLESFDITPPADRPRWSKGEIDHRIFLIGLEIGTRYQFTSDWFGTAALGFDFLPGERGSAALILGVGYALQLPEGL